MSEPRPQSEDQQTDIEYGAGEYCGKCHGEKIWVDCSACGGEGLDGHDCGEDCCCCLHPEDNVTCDLCEGAGGWMACPNCEPGAFDDY